MFWTFYNPRVEPDEPAVFKRPLRGREVSVVLGGDFAPADSATGLIRRHGYRYPYLRTAHILRSADVSFLNLEAPVTRYPHKFRLYKWYNYRVMPEAVEAFTWFGLDLVSLANNHMKDRTDRGLVDTLRHLEAAAVGWVGAGRTEAEARRPVIFDVGGTRIGFLAYLEDWFFYNLYLRVFAVGNRAGCARFVWSDVARDIQNLRPKVDVLVVSMHWGRTYSGTTRAQKQMARFLAKRGVDVVVGHHPHIVQPVEVRGRTVIFYSLGNYAWGAWGRDSFRIGLLARLRITPRSAQRPGRIAGVELIPIVTQNRVVRFQPRPIIPRELGWVRSFVEASRRLGTRIRTVGTTLQVDLQSK